MKIASNTIALATQHTLSERREQNLSLRTAATAVSDSTSASPRIELSSAGQALLDAARQQTGAASLSRPANKDNETVLPVPLQILKSLIEKLTGQPIHICDGSGLAAASGGTDTTAAQLPASSPAGQEPSFAFDSRSVTETSETSDFAASGSVTLADGSQIQFSLSLSLQRTQREESSLSIRSGAAARSQDPLILSFGSGVRTNGERTDFALAPGIDSLPVLDGAAYLVRDANGNGRVDGSSELFGPTSGDGFAELAKLDDDGNGWIDEGDASFTQLKLWQPEADDKGELVTLKEAGVGALYLGRVASPFTLADGSGKEQAKLRSSGVYLNEDGSAGALQQIDVVA